MFGIGMPEMILILAVALIVIGPKKLPDLAKTLGQALGEFRKAARELKDAIEIESDLGSVKEAVDDIQHHFSSKDKSTDVATDISQNGIIPSIESDKKTGDPEGEQKGSEGSFKND